MVEIDEVSKTMHESRTMTTNTALSVATVAKVDNEHASMNTSNTLPIEPDVESQVVANDSHNKDEHASDYGYVDDADCVLQDQALAESASHATSTHKLDKVLKEELQQESVDNVAIDTQSETSKCSMSKTTVEAKNEVDFLKELYSSVTTTSHKQSSSSAATAAAAAITTTTAIPEATATKWTAASGDEHIQTNNSQTPLTTEKLSPFSQAAGGDRQSASPDAELLDNRQKVSPVIETLNESKDYMLLNQTDVIRPTEFEALPPSTVAATALPPPETTTILAMPTALLEGQNHAAESNTTTSFDVPDSIYPNNVALSSEFVNQPQLQLQRQSLSTRDDAVVVDFRFDDQPDLQQDVQQLHMQVLIPYRHYRQFPELERLPAWCFDIVIDMLQPESMIFPDCTWNDSNIDNLHDDINQTNLATTTFCESCAWQDAFVTVVVAEYEAVVQILKEKTAKFNQDQKHDCKILFNCDNAAVEALDIVRTAITGLPYEYQQRARLN
ncbi:hypothetical protein V1514DRAFT_61433 [Lipomyces japonicus]|uniref:uncharacterized protein n=1 Tax=Lipomyces japonicus TaxID=56871 RepID=UPI0034CDAC9E